MELPGPDDAEEAVPDLLDDGLPAARSLLPVVGLGGSAGAIPALTTFMRNVPAEPGLAFVVIIHLSPEHDSTLAELLQRHTAMRVVQVQRSVRVEADSVYVIPPGKGLRMLGDQLELTELPKERAGRVAVDLFFRTLADSHGPHATAIVLSGADSDGAIGVKRIKERGGLTIAQDPAEAEVGGMPRAAIATGMVDWVLPVAEMPARVLSYLSLETRLQLPPEQPDPADPGRSETELREVLNFLRNRTGRDFSNYKRATILRRIGRRMQVNGVAQLSDYLGCLRTRPGEAGALLQDLLISVTNFFRDADCFAALEAQLPALFREKSAGAALRVWVAACATGEEAYSIAMLLAEHARTLDSPPAIQVFATDLDEEAIRVAREGIYPPTIAADVSEERLRRFFTREHRGYRVRRELREQVLFAPHDLLKDSPFSRLDLMSCRNLLIYLNRNAQRRVFETAHFALAPTGRLFLGASETVDDNSPLFFVVDKKHRLFMPRPIQRTALPVPVGQSSIARALEAQVASLALPAVPRTTFAIEPPGGTAMRQPSGRPVSWAELHFRMLEALAPPSLLVDAEHDIVHVSVNAGRFLQFGGGEPSRNLLHSIHPALRMELRAALYQAAQSGSRIDVAPLTVDVGGQMELVRIAVLPMTPVAPGMLLVQFEASAGAEDAAPQASASKGEPDPLAHLLERELERLKSHLRDTVEQYEASTEELKASNEELQAMNEELRSATEELETSREELQSINEELTTVNHELKGKVDELGHANSDMQNLMDATAIATVFLDRDLHVTRYTPSAVSLFNLIPTDVGRPLAHLSNHLDYPELDTDARRVLQGLVPIEREVDDLQGHWYLVRMLPYRTADDRIAGIVLTLVDITERKRSQEALQLSEQRFGAIASKAAVGVLQCSIEGDITFANPYFTDLLGYREGELPGRPLLDLVHPDDRPASAALISGLPRTRQFQVEKRCLRKGGGTIWIHSSVSLLPLDDEHGAVLVVCTDISERRRASEALRASEERLRLMVDNAVEYAIFSTDLQRRVTAWNAGAQRLLGYSEAEILGQSADLIFVDEERAAGVPGREADVALAEGRASDDRLHQRKDGSRFWASGATMPMHDASQRVVGFVKILRDQTAVRESQQALAQSRAELLVALEENERARDLLQTADLAKDRFLAVLSHELRNPLASISGAAEALGVQGQADRASEARARGILRRQIDAMRLLLDDLLDISRLRFGRLELHRRPTALQAIIDGAIETVRPEIDRRGHALGLAIPAAPLMLDADPARLGQVLANLLVNAAKYTSDGGHIELAVRVEGGEVVVVVSDDGRGLDQETLASMFEMFWRSSEPDPAGGASLGIGLSLVRSIVRLHGGRIEAASDGPGRGSRFSVTLPLLAEAGVAAEPAAQARPRGEPIDRRRILVADDNEDIAWTLATVLGAAGYDVRTATSGHDALAVMDDFGPDAAILDIAMPGMSGYEVAERVRAGPGGGTVLLLAATGWGSEADRQASSLAGFDAHLVKPINIDELRQMIDTLPSRGE